MEGSSVARHHDDGVGSGSQEINWDAYASQYDLLAANNPSYRENIEMLRSRLTSFQLPNEAAICDVGAGTGNFICALASRLPSARFVHLDSDPAMNEIAIKKYEHAGIKHVDVHCCSAVEATYGAESFDLIVCVNALYAMHPQEETLNKIKTWLKPSGKLFIIDYGRQVKVLDWLLYILWNVAREQGVREAYRFLRNSIESIRQNRRGSRGQAEGVYWLHSTEEFGQILYSAGLHVEELKPCYRGYCDLAVCRLRQT